MEVFKNSKMTYACQRIGLEISDICYARLDSAWCLKNMRSSFTRIYFPLEGSGTLTVNGEKIELCPNNIYIIPSGLSFSGECPESLNKLFVHLTVKYPDGTDLFYGLDKCIILREQGEKIRILKELYEENSVMSVLKFKLQIYGILEAALSDVPSCNSGLKVYSRLTKDILEYIDGNLGADLTVDQISRALFTPKSTLQRCFKKDTGRTVGEYIDGCLDVLAERELLDPHLSIRDISERLGYCDQFYFSRKFKKAHGISPRVFRQKHNI